LFRNLALNRVEAVIAMATLQERQVVRLLAIDALGFATDARAATVLRSVEHDADPMIAATARDALSRLDTDSATARRNAYAAAAQVRRVAQERLAA
jgi:hypothetical protein